MKDATLEGITETWSQDADCCETGIINILEVKSQDGGGGWYLVIKTERWSLNDDADIDGFAALLKAALAREPKERVTP